MTDRSQTVSLPVTAEQIQDLLPHRYPFLLVDRVTEVTLGEHILAYKNLTINEPFFQGHFPGHPVMPGVLIIEALAQAAGVLVRLSETAEIDGKPLFYLVKVDKARFSAMVVPGDQLQLDVTLKRTLRGMGLFEGRALVDGKEVASCELMCAGRAE
jgi:3-hydroxyacyl-[acyl-carrier-protein] dehydratase